jgi:hypothetical protein
MVNLRAHTEACEGFSLESSTRKPGDDGNGGGTRGRIGVERTGKGFEKVCSETFAGSFPLKVKQESPKGQHQRLFAGPRTRSFAPSSTEESCTFS